uniref:Poly [ADP-ribose] polymerase n=1 Tax=Electrophorus electricus TaxID=8005 RepID=A0AAY5F6D2_ELEEL
MFVFLVLRAETYSEGRSKGFVGNVRLMVCFETVHVMSTVVLLPKGRRCHKFTQSSRTGRKTHTWKSSGEITFVRFRLTACCAYGYVCVLLLVPCLTKAVLTLPCRLYKGNEDNTPEFPSHFQVAEYSFFLKVSLLHETVSVVQDQQVHCCSSEDALEAYVQFNTELQSQGFTQTESLPSEAEALASHTLQRLLLEERLSCCDVSQDVGVFLELIWTEALGSLASLLTVPVTSLSLNDVSRVEGLLLQVQKCESEDEVQLLLQEVSTLLPLRETEAEARAKLVSQRLDLCQLIRDILNVSEATLGNPSPSSLGKYCTLRCNIEPVASESPEYQSVCKILQERPVQIQQVLRVCRSSELHMFREQLCNIKPLLHSTFPSNFVGILSRGLLLPRVGVEQHGIKRTDVGNLGSGIYFSDSLNTSVKYSRPSVTDGSRLLLVCDVALGQCKDVYKKDPSLICAPDGHSSVHGVRRTQSTRSRDDEYVVYNTDQVRLKYVVQYFLKEDQLKPFEPHIDTSVECLPSVMTSDLLSSDDAEGLEVTKNPLEDVTPGLLDSSGSTLPLEAVHVRCKLMDLLCQVIIFQVYTNKSDILIEAKYVFPLEETAAVCGFEAFINGKHVVGKVKEKEQARKEYKQAIEKGHGAYLMDQEAPDVFTISVGNLPAGATVLIKVTYITELAMRSGTVVFSLPASVAPWQQELVLMLGLFVVFSLHMSIEMPYEITGLECSHRIRTKRTDCKAMVVTLPDQSLSTDGFQLSFSLSQMHMPRMWVEKHPEKDSEACMLVFYPDFECGDARWSGVSDVVIVLDTSESMRGEPLVNARRLALKALCSLDRSLRVNVVCFGIDYKEAFPSPRVLEEVFEQAKTFIMSSPAVGGSTELWRPLRSLNLLPPSRGLRNVLLLSDGHMQNQPQTLQLVRGNACHTRLFTCGLRWARSKTAVKSQVRCMASPGCMSVSVKWQRFNPTEPPPVQAPSQLSALFSNCHTLVYGFMPHCSQATLFGDLSGQEIQTMVSTTELQKTKGTFLHKLTARAIIRDYEDGSLGISEAEHEGRKAELKSYIIELSKEFSILSQFTSFVAIEERQPESGFTSVPDLISEGDGNVDILPYMGWLEEEEEGSSLSDPYLMEVLTWIRDFFNLILKCFNFVFPWTQDGYWECTWRLSTFLGLDVDFFANVFLKEKGICSLGVKVHTAILRLVATLLVLQLVRVKMVLGVELFHSLMHLANAPKSRPACWEAVQRAVSWAQGADRQYPCVCTRLKLGWDWESCTRQLLGLDAPPPHSPLLPVLQRSCFFHMDKSVV